MDGLCLLTSIIKELSAITTSCIMGILGDGSAHR